MSHIEIESESARWRNVGNFVNTGTFVMTHCGYHVIIY